MFGRRHFCPEEYGHAQTMCRSDVGKFVLSFYFSAEHFSLSNIFPYNPISDHICFQNVKIKDKYTIYKCRRR